MTHYSSNEYQELWSSSKYPPSLYRIFGYILSKYAGSFNPAKNIIETYVRNPEIFSDKMKIHNIKKVCHDLLEETALNNDLIHKTEIDEFNEITKEIFISNNICNYLQAINFNDEIELFTSCKRTSDTYLLSLNQRLEFIIGVYLNHAYDKTKLVFYNNYFKMAMTHRFMIELADEDDIITTISEFKTPHSHIIEINENGQLWTTMQMLMKKYGYKL